MKSLLLLAASGLLFSTVTATAPSDSSCRELPGAHALPQVHNVVVTTTNGQADAIRLAKENVRGMFGSHTPTGATYKGNDGWFTHYVSVSCTCR